MSILPGFQHDIFISYRHNDNHSGWVTEFVKDLQEELATTIKDPVSVYFDTNPHDGLLENHNVDKSLEEKLKCFIFIPILSQTYCDPRSFAWSHEFCAFNRIATNDQLGRDLKLTNGNIASRILPVKIHDLDLEDKMVIENEIGGALRAIEFIFKSQGVNRPLNVHENNPQFNLNKTFYRDQVNKVANAIKELIIAVKIPQDSAKQISYTVVRTPESRKSVSKRNLAITGVILIATTLLISSYFLLFKSQREMEADKSVAVLAFSDLSPDKDQEWFSDGLTEEILNSLANLHGLKVTARTSSFYFKGKDASLQEIGHQLGVAHILEGSVRRLGQQLRITTQLIRVQDGFHVWSETYERTTEDLFKVQEEIAENVAKALLKEITPEKKVQLRTNKPTNIEAYDQYLKGLKIYYLAHIDFDDSLLLDANSYFENVIALDPSFGYPYYFISDYYVHQIEKPTLIGVQREIAFSKIHEYLDKAITFSEDSSMTKLLKVEKALMSDNWNSLSKLLGSFIRDPKASQVASDTGMGVNVLAFHLLGRQDDLLKICNEAVKIDPLNTILWQFGAWSLLKDHPDQALTFLGEGEAKLKTRFPGLHEQIESKIQELKNPSKRYIVLPEQIQFVDNLPHGHLIMMGYLYDRDSINLKLAPNFALRLQELNKSN